jgi:hypothetical protein
MYINYLKSPPLDTPDVDISKITKINYEKYLKKMKGLFKQWNKRTLTPIGKITVVKSLILPVHNC